MNICNDRSRVDVIFSSVGSLIQAFKTTLDT
jgi:hypothetical protein